MLHQVLLGAAAPLDAAGFILRGIRAIFVIIGSVVAAIVCALIAAVKGRSALLYGICGLFFSIITLIVIILLPSRRRV